MKTLSSIIIIVAFATALYSCGGAETKIDPTDTLRANDTSTTQTAPEPVPEEKINTTTEPRSGAVDSPINNERNEILKNIDQHLVSTQTASDRVTVENKLPDVDFQRVIVEVSEVNETGQATRTNFYQITNLDAGSKKIIKITPPSAGARVDIHIVKAKSASLTKGEMILVGSRYAP